MDHDTYSMPADFITLLGRQHLSLNARRLVHGLYYGVGRALPDEKLWGMAASSDRRIRLTPLRETFGPRGAKDNRVYHAAIEELAQNRALFSKLEKIANGRGVLCRFSTLVVDCSRGKDAGFARFTLDDVAHCRCATELRFLEMVRLHRKKRRPLFCLPGYDGKKPNPHWPRERDRWLRAARNVAAHTGDRFLFALVYDDWEPGKLTINVKISNDTTGWDPGKLYSARALTQVIEIGVSGHQYLDTQTVATRRHLTNVHSPMA